MKPIVQISLDIVDLNEALETSETAIASGVDWLEAGTPLIIAEGMHGVRALRARFPDVPIVADLKTMDGGWLEAELMAKAGATHVVVMARAPRRDHQMRRSSPERISASRSWGDNLGCEDMVDGSSLPRRSRMRLCGSPHRIR